MELNQYFPDKVCINLDRRPERWERVSERFRKHAIDGIERFSAIDSRVVSNPRGWRGPPGAYACAQSHLAVVRHARVSGIKRLLIFEDDVEFDERLNERFSDLIGGLPEKWDMLFFGSLLSREPEIVSPGIGRVQKAHSTFAYALNHTIFDAFIALNTGARQPVDNNNTLLQERFYCYAFYPFLAWVESGHSDVEGASVDHWQIRESLILKSAEMGRIMAKTCVIVSPCLNGRPGVDEAHLDFLADSILSMSAEISMVILQPETMRDEELARWTDRPRIEIRKSGAASSGKSALLAAREKRAAGSEYFYFPDSDFSMRRPDLKACLLMSARHGFVRPCSTVIKLSEAGTGRLLDGELRWFDESNGESRSAIEEAPNVWIVKAGDLDRLSDWPPPDDFVARCDWFQAPASAARLFGRVKSD